MRQKKPTFGAVAFLGFCILSCSYFTFSAVQGESGLFQRLRAEAEVGKLRAELESYQAEVALLENKTRRLSDDYLDLDLLDEQARSVLGMTRANEIIIP